MNEQVNTMTEQDIRVTLVQFNITWEASAVNLQKIWALLDEKVSDTDLVVLPEMFTTGFSMNPTAVAEPMNGKTVAWLKSTARTRREDIVASVAIEEGGRYFNRLLWAKPDGSLLAYDKKHLFSFAGEHKHYTPGEEPLIATINNWKVATFICYDLRFPSWSRNVDARYDLAIYIANWPERRAKHWQVLLQARAIENQAYVIGVNRVGTDGNGIRYSGDSMLIDPLGEVLFHQRDTEVVQTETLSMRHLLEVRNQFPFLKDADKFTFFR